MQCYFAVYYVLVQHVKAVTNATWILILLHEDDNLDFLKIVSYFLSTRVVRKNSSFGIMLVLRNDYPNGISF